MMITHVENPSTVMLFRWENMNTKEMIGLVFVILASLSTQLPHVLFKHHPKMTGAELAEKYPELAWLRFSYPLLSVIWFLIFGGVPLFLMFGSTFLSFIPLQAMIYVLGGAIGSISILHGLLGLITNVCPIPRKRSRLYVYEDDMQPTALLLMAAGVFVIIIALAMIYFYVF